METRVELGVSVVDVVVASVITAFFLGGLFGAPNPGYLAGNLILFLVWVGVCVFSLSRWKRHADRLVQIISATCEAATRQE